MIHRTGCAVAKLNLLPHQLPYKHALAVALCAMHGVASTQEPLHPPQPDVLVLRASAELMRDSNFRLAPVNPSASDQIRTLTLALSVALPISQQKLLFDAELKSVRHKLFTGFDFTAQNVKAAWAWRYTPELSGSLFVGQSQALNPVTDSLEPTARNKNTTRTGGLLMSYGFKGAWQLLGSVQRTRSTNEQALIGGGDSDISSVGAGVRYKLASGSFLGYDLRRDRGDSERAGVDAELLSRKFTSVSHGLVGAWLAGPDATLQAQLLHQANVYDEDAAYDFSGLSGAVKLTYKLTEKTVIDAALARETVAYQTRTSTHTRTDSMSLTPVWNISPKTAVQLGYTVAVRRDLGQPGDIASERRDTTYDSSLGLKWQPSRQVSLTGKLLWGRRQSNLSEFEYSVRKSSIDALLTF